MWGLYFCAEKHVFGVNRLKVEFWNTGGKPKYWTVLFFSSDKKDFPEQISKVMVAEPEKGGNWFRISLQRDETWDEMIKYGETIANVERSYLETIPLYI